MIKINSRKHACYVYVVFHHSCPTSTNLEREYEKQVIQYVINYIFRSFIAENTKENQVAKNVEITIIASVQMHYLLLPLIAFPWEFLLHKIPNLLY